MAKMWTKKEEGFLKKHYRKMGGEELAKKFDVSPEAIRRKEKRLGLVREHPCRKKEKKTILSLPKKWTEREEQYLREHYLEKSNVKLAKKLKTTPKSVEKKLWRMGLKRRKRGADRSPGEGRERESGKKGEKERRIEKFLREKHPSEGEKKIDEQRPRAIEGFEAAMRLYCAQKYRPAESAFRRLVKDFADVHDIVYKAKQYLKFCLNRK